MDIAMKEHDGCVVASLSGVIDETAKTIFDEHLHSVIESPGARLLVDLSNAPRITSAGIGVLVTLVSRANTKKGRVVLAQPTPFVNSILESTKLTKFFEIEETVEEGLARLQDREDA